MPRRSAELVATTEEAAPQPAAAPISSLRDLSDPAAVLARLQAIDWSFTQEDTRYLAHDLHPYPAKFVPQIPSNLITSLSLPGESVWDPFGGSGTTALEALLLGRRPISTDLNPLATLITRAKCSSLSPEQRSALVALRDRIADVATASELGATLRRLESRTQRFVPMIPNLENWFGAQVTQELALVLHEIEGGADADAQVFARIVLSSIIVNVSNQDEETRYARRIKNIRGGDVLRSFARALDESLRKHEPLERLIGYRRVRAETVDARDGLKLREHVPDRSVDLVVTSPPYANATDYHLYHRFRLFWLGFDPRKMAEAEIGSHLRHQRERRTFDLYEDEMRAVLVNVATRVRSGRYVVLVVGDSVFEGKTVRTAEALLRMGPEVGLEPVGVITRSVHATKRSFIAAARRTRTEDVVVLRVAPSPLRICLRPPPYRPWPYENVLRKLEAESVLAQTPRDAKGSLSVMLDSYDVDRIQRLTFTHVAETNDGARWRTWQATLENGEAVSQRKDPKYLTHGIHPYKGKFYPQLAKSLLNLAAVPPLGTVLDPFCGSGTVLLEAQLNGARPVGVDLNPLAALISRAKTAVAVANPYVLDRAVKDFADRISHDGSGDRHCEHFAADLRDEIDRWFPRPVVRRLGWLLDTIDTVGNTTARLVLQVLVSSIIRDVSQQEPTDLRIRRRKKPLTDAPVLPLLAARIKEFRERLHQFEHRRGAAPCDFMEATVISGDAREVGTLQRWHQRVDCVVTSPPYATALPYIDTDRLSLLTVLGLPSRDRGDLEQRLAGSREIRETERRTLETLIESSAADESVGSPAAMRIVRRVLERNVAGDVGFRRRNMAALLFRYFRDMRTVMLNVGRTVKPGANLFFVIGDNKTEAGGEMVAIQSTKALCEIGTSCGWTHVDTIPITVTKEALMHSKNSITENGIIWFRAPQSAENDDGPA